MRDELRGRAVRRGTPMAVLLVCLASAACSVPNELNPVAIYNRISGNDDASRLPPPGLDRPTPNLASVPPRPERPPLALRESITSSLAGDRSSSREPLQLRTVPLEGKAPPAELSGEQAMPAAPPRRPALAAAPAIPWGEGAARPRT